MLRNDVFANGVNYLQLDFDLHGLPDALWPFLPRYLDALNKLGAAGMSYERIAHRVAAFTGGIHGWPFFSTHAIDASHSLRSVRLQPAKCWMNRRKRRWGCCAIYCSP